MPPTALPIDWTLPGILLGGIAAVTTALVYVFFLYVKARDRHETKIDALHGDLLPKIDAYVKGAERMSTNAERLLDAAVKLAAKLP